MATTSIPVPEHVDHVWAMGGRLLDLPSHYLDRVATDIASLPQQPPAIRRAQQQISTGGGEA